ncbi:MAG: hypothetical protein QM715_07520 [Nibricoccus sp.]
MWLKCTAVLAFVALTGSLRANFIDINIASSRAQITSPAQLEALLADKSSIVLALEETPFPDTVPTKITKPGPTNVPNSILVDGKQVPVKFPELGTKAELRPVTFADWGRAVKIDFHHKSISVDEKGEIIVMGPLPVLFGVKVQGVVLNLRWDKWTFLAPMPQQDGSYAILAMRLRRG